MTKVTFNMLAYSFCYVFDTNIVFYQLPEKKIHVLFSGDMPLEMDRVLISNIEVALKIIKK